MIGAGWCRSASSTALTVYAHNWGLFLGVGMGVAFLVLWRTAPEGERAPLFRDGLIGFGLLAVLYLPWVPTLLFQADHTGAPWSAKPPLDGLISGMQNLVGGVETALLLTVVAAAGLTTLRGGAEGRERSRSVVALAVMLGVAMALAWLASQASPAWATRYFSVFVGPALLLAGAGIVRFGKVGLVALAIVLVLWFDSHERSIRGKSDAYRVARTLQENGLIAPRDLVVAIHPEYGPAMRYLPRRRATAGPTPMGPVSDNRVFDWRDALDRLKAAGPKRTLDKLAPEVEVGQHLILIQPIIRTGRWGAPWTAEIRHRAPAGGARWTTTGASSGSCRCRSSGARARPRACGPWSTCADSAPGNAQAEFRTTCRSRVDPEVMPEEPTAPPRRRRRVPSARRFRCGGDRQLRRHLRRASAASS